MVEHGVASENRNDLAVGESVMAEASLLDPTEELKSESGARGGIAKDGKDERLGEGWDEGANGVLEAGGPGSAGHHVTNGGGHVVSGFSAMGSLGGGGGV